MKYRSALCFLALFCFAMTVEAAEEAKKVVVKVEVKGVRPNRRGRPDKPNVAKTAAELIKAVGSKEAAEAVKKQVDFEKQDVFVFSWFGSGQDKINAVSKDGKITFLYKPGRTRDLRPHVHVYAVDKGVKWSVERGRFGR